MGNEKYWWSRWGEMRNSGGAGGWEMRNTGGADGGK